MTYEHIRPDDAFGHMMLNNLEERRVYLKSIREFPTLEKQEERYREAGYNYAKAVDMTMMEHALVDKDECDRLRFVEVLDEVEEWNMLCQHYAFVWAAKANTKGEMLDITFPPQRQE
jgi:tRNA wybutosine-synthesizing protein 4